MRRKGLGQKQLHLQQSVYGVVVPRILTNEGLPCHSVPPPVTLHPPARPYISQAPQAPNNHCSPPRVATLEMTVVLKGR